MSKHTTWRWDENWLVRELHPQRGSDHVLYYTTADDGLHGSESDKALIAAAPEMLKALKRAEDHFRLLPPEMDAPGSVMAEMCAAIAKAEGRS